MKLVFPKELVSEQRPNEKGQVSFELETNEQVIVHFRPSCGCTVMTEHYVFPGKHTVSATINGYLGGSRYKSINYTVKTLAGKQIDSGLISLLIKVV